MNDEKFHSLLSRMGSVLRLEATDGESEMQLAGEAILSATKPRWYQFRRTLEGINYLNSSPNFPDDLRLAAYPSDLETLAELLVSTGTSDPDAASEESSYFLNQRVIYDSPTARTKIEFTPRVDSTDPDQDSRNVWVIVYRKDHL